MESRGPAREGAVLYGLALLPWHVSWHLALSMGRNSPPLAQGQAGFTEGLQAQEEAVGRARACQLYLWTHT